MFSVLHEVLVTLFQEEPQEGTRVKIRAMAQFPSGGYLKYDFAIWKREMIEAGYMRKVPNGF